MITIDIICHGVPSPDVWSKYVKFRENEVGSPVKKINFRQKDEGWKRYSVSFLYRNNTEYRQNLRKDLYMRAFLKDVCLRPSCYRCNFKTLNRQSDITLADFWGIQNILPEMDDDKGTSLIFINSHIGRDIINEIFDKMTYKEVDIHQAIKYNSAAITPAKPNINREKFFADRNSLPFDILVKKYCTDKFTVKLVMNKFKSVIKWVAIKLGLLKIVRKVISNIKY